MQKIEIFSPIAKKECEFNEINLLDLSFGECEKPKSI